ncbi:MAG: segregation and condensation protein A [Phycisphaerales bacterium]|jgi:segregation and condensation protein A
MPSDEVLQVRLNAFEGPLDLLLFLIRRAEVDIHDIPIAQITQQYLDTVARARDLDVEQAGEFLVMAATLVEIKSRMLAPRLEGADPEDPLVPSEAGEDPRRDLVRQLLAYQRFRSAADGLDRLRREFEQRWPASGSAETSGDETLRPDVTPQDLDLGDVHVLDLLEAFERLSAAVDFTRLGEHAVTMDDTPIGLHQDDLVDRLARSPERRMTLQRVFEGRSRMDRIGLFLALLELARQQRIKVRQASAADAIELELLEGEPLPASEPSASSSLAP